MRKSVSKELNYLARCLGWSKSQLRRAKRQYLATPSNDRGKAMAELRLGNAKVRANQAGEGS